MQSQLETLTENIQNFRRKQILAQNQIQRINNEKAEIECQLKEKEHQMGALKQKLDFIVKNEEEDSKKVEAPVEDSQPQEIHEEELKDPNRPRYTFNELQEVLLEKNELKEKLIETQEQLELLKR